MSEQPKVLVVDDNEAICRILSGTLLNNGIEAEAVSSAAEALKLQKSKKFQVLIVDLHMPEMTGLDLIREIHRHDPHLPIIVITGSNSADDAIEATRTGAFDYLLKPFKPEEVLRSVRKALQVYECSAEPVGMGDESISEKCLVGKSAAMQEIYRQIGFFADSNVSILIQGATGTGKELVARAFCQHSSRKTKPFIPVNCAAIPEQLLESDLFGHERGAFTGAERRKLGRFEQANGGTLFLDEIGDLSSSTQAKLLRVLQEKEIQRLGGVEFIPVDVRVIAATHIDLEAAMEKGTFRQDLYYRLNGVTIRLPALKDRSDDIPALVEYLLKIHGHRLGYPQASIEPETLTWLQQQPWPGNIRQLENVVCQALLEARQYPIQQSHCVALSHSRSRPASASLSAEETIADLANDVLKRAQKGEVSHPMQAMTELFERALIEQALQVCHGRKSAAAKLLGISRPTLYQKMDHYQLSLAEDGSSARNQT